MRAYKKQALCLALAGLLTATAWLTACDTTDQPGGDTTAPDTQAATDPAVNEIAHTVTVQNLDGTPAQNIVIRVKQGSEEKGMKLTNPQGAATFKLVPGDYTVSLESQTGTVFYYDTSAAIFTKEKTAVDLRICPMATETVEMMAPPRLPAGSTESPEYQKTDALLVRTGTCYVSLSATDYTYMLFEPTRGGMYTIQCTPGVEFTYHGMAASMMSQAMLTPDENGLITLKIEDGSVGGGSVTQQVFRLYPAEGQSLTGTTVTITRTGDIPKTPEELADWTIIEADQAFLKSYEGDTTGTLTDLDVTKPGLTVVLGTDGYYHYGTADGPVVFLRIASENKYTQSFTKMLETDRIRAYFYDENGTFLRKEGYSQLIESYAEFANDDGVVPLNQQLADVMKKAGSATGMGWYDFASGRDIFGDLVIPPETAWLFACAYYA